MKIKRIIKHWNPEVQLTHELKDRTLVEPIGYMEVNQLIGTSGCSRYHPYWDWSVLGVIEMDHGKLLVSPGDTIIEYEHPGPAPVIVVIPNLLDKDDLEKILKEQENE